MSDTPSGFILPATGGSDGLDPSTRLLNRLDKVKRTGEGRWMARCPAHDDKNPSLSIGLGDDGKALVHCFAGCSSDDVLAAVGLEYRQLFRDDVDYRPSSNGSKPPPALSDAKFTLEMLQLSTEAGSPLTELGRSQCLEAIEVIAAAGETPSWYPPVPIQQDPQQRPRPITQPEFDKTEWPPEEPILGPFKTQQLALVYAPTGAGKTQYNLNLAWAMSTGSDIFGWKSAGPIKVLYIDGEMSAWELKSRLNGLHAPNLFLYSSVGMSMDSGCGPLNLATPEGQADLLRWVEEDDIKAVFLDNLMSLNYVEGTSINSDESFRPFNHVCLELRSRGVFVATTDHANTAGGVHGTKTKTWHMNHSISIKTIDDEVENEIGGFDHPMKAGQRKRIRVVWEKHRGREETGADGDLMTEEIVLTIGAVGQDWERELGKAVMRKKAIAMAEEGMSQRDISDELHIAKSTIGRWTKGVRKLK